MGTIDRPEPESRTVTFELMSDDPDYYFVLTTALGDFAAQARAEAREGANPESNIRWAETAEDALWRVEMALAGRSENYACLTCGALVGIFIGHGRTWRHYRGEGTGASPVELYDAGHEAVPGGAR